MSIFKTHDKEIVLKEISKLKPVSHNKYFWWRKYDSTTVPILKNSTIIEKIKSGYYDFSSYFWQAQLALVELNDLYVKNKDYGAWVESSSIIRARYKRLMEDYYKDEDERMERIINDFTKSYILKKDQVKEILENFGGTIQDLYILFEEKYKYNIQPSWKRTF